MGYGVVKPSLGKTMIYVRWLAIAHFVFGLVYAITSLLVSPEAAGMLSVNSCNERRIANGLQALSSFLSSFHWRAL
jgi:hypothetical protein